MDVATSLSMLFVIVVCGTVRNHASRCGVSTPIPETCFKPATLVFSFFHIDRVIATPMGETVLAVVMNLVPILYCLTIMLGNSRIAVKHSGWPVFDVVLYEFVAMGAGCLAGLVGIGGGLIFAPFFLWQNLNPSVAVATSSTCVLFTSSSTTLQYLFTDRIIVPQALAYGFVNLIASVLGTKIVHWLKDLPRSRESVITGIVAVGVGISAVISVYKMLHPVRHLAEHT